MRSLALIISSFFLSKNVISATGLRVIWHGSPSVQAVVIWESKNKGPVKLCLTNRETDQLFKCLDSTPRKLSVFSRRRSHIVYARGLSPNTSYNLSFGKNPKVRGYFITAPNKGDPQDISLFSGGDSRSQRKTRQAINLAMKKYWSEHPEVLGLAHGGDYISNGHFWYQWKRWIYDYGLTQLEDGRLLPLIPVRGNHEKEGKLYDILFGTPGKKGQNYFSTHLGPLTLIQLNSNIAHGGNQKSWLISELKKAKSTQKWIVPTYHRPAFPAVKKPGNARRFWVPLFEDFQVDLVLESDGHALKRTGPIYRNKINEDKGIVYIGEGGLGVKQRYPKQENRWYFRGGIAMSAHHFHVLNFKEKKLEVRAFSPSLKELDFYQKEKK